MRTKSLGGKIEFSIGDGVNWGAGSDRIAGTVVRISDTGFSIYVVEDSAKLLNGANSGELDKLCFESGGFVGHTSGQQRYEFSPGSGPELKFSLRKGGNFKLAGTSLTGSMGSWGILSMGRIKHYDFNF